MLNATVGFVQEFQAGSIVEELKKTLALKAVVLRDGRLTEVEAPMVVPGDILQLEEVGFVACRALGASQANIPRELSSQLMAALLRKMPTSKLINLPLPVNLSL